jgi:hypothetical protein
VTAFRRIAILLIVTLLAGGISSLGDEGGDGGGGGGAGGGSSNNGPVREKRPPRSKNGSYEVRVNGYYKGAGTATVTAQNVSISADVKADDGTATTLKADNLKVTGAYFTGTGTVGGKNVAIKGRLDAAKISRLTAMYKTDDNHRGRIVGSLPGDAPNDKWDDDHDDPPGPATQNRPH